MSERTPFSEADLCKALEFCEQIKAIFASLYIEVNLPLPRWYKPWWLVQRRILRSMRIEVKRAEHEKRRAAYRARRAELVAHTYRRVG